jgi:hypothetical protein
MTNAAQARNALARAGACEKQSSWMKTRGVSCAELKKKVANKVKKDFPSVEVGEDFKPVMGELVIEVDGIPANVEVRVVDRVDGKAFVEYANRLVEVTTASVLIYPEGADLATCLEAVRAGKMTMEEAGAKRLECREKAKRLSEIPEMKVSSDATFLAAYLPRDKFATTLTEMEKMGDVSGIEDTSTIYCYLGEGADREALVKVVEDAGGHLIQSRVAFAYDPNKPLSEQIVSEVFKTKGWTLFELNEEEVRKVAQTLTGGNTDKHQFWKALNGAFRGDVEVLENPSGGFSILMDPRISKDFQHYLSAGLGLKVQESSKERLNTILEQIDDGEGDVAKDVNGLFITANENLKQIRQLFVDVQTAAVQKAMALLQGAGKGKKTVGALKKLGTALDIEVMVKDLTKKMEQLNKAHDVFVSEFPEAAEEEKPEVPEAPETPAPEAPPAEEPVPEAPPAPAPETPPAPATAEDRIRDAVITVSESGDWALLCGLFERGETYGKISGVVRDIVPDLDTMEINEVIHRLVDLA